MKSRSNDPFGHNYHGTWQMIFWPHDEMNRLKKKTLKLSLNKFQPLLKATLTAIATYFLFLGGTYLFLIQLAEYGW